MNLRIFMLLPDPPEDNTTANTTNPATEPTTSVPVADTTSTTSQVRKGDQPPAPDGGGVEPAEDPNEE